MIDLRSAVSADCGSVFGWRQQFKSIGDRIYDFIVQINKKFELAEVAIYDFSKLAPHGRTDFCP